MKKIFRLPNKHKEDLQNKTITFRSWIFGFGEPKLRSEDLKIFKVSEGKLYDTYEIKKKLLFKDIKELLNEMCSARLCTFKGTSKSSIIKVYIDNKVYRTRTKGKLKIKQGKFKTNLPWLREELIRRGLEDTTPENY